MAINTVSVTVPASGDGPVADISALVGQKTVILTGRFRGSYTLLVSDNDADFVPAAFFDADGIEGIEQTISGSFKSARVRSNAVASGPVTMEVTGIVGLNENHFTTLATLPPGNGGVGAVIDTAALFPPSGLEEDIAFLCRGTFEGSIAVMGSNDGADWNPIGDFKAGPVQRTLLGQTQVLEFSPLSTKDLTRYLRIDANARISITTVVTVGGRIPLGGGAGGSELLADIHEDEARSTSFLAAGLEIIYEETVDLSEVPAGTPLLLRFSGILRTTNGAVGTIIVNVGATNPGDASGGTGVASITGAPGTDQQISVLSGPFANPGGTDVLVQVVAGCNPSSEIAFLRGIDIKIMVQ